MLDFAEGFFYIYWDDRMIFVFLYGLYIYWPTLSYLWNSGIKSTWSWWKVFLKYIYIQFAGILLRNFESVVIQHIGLWLSFCSCCWWWWCDDSMCVFIWFWYCHDTISKGVEVPFLFLFLLFYIFYSLDGLVIEFLWNSGSSLPWIHLGLGILSWKAFYYSLNYFIYYCSI